MNQKETGKLIAKCRKEKKLTQAQLAERLNVTDRAVSKWETGKSVPDASIMLELCGILGITADELLSGEESDMNDDEEKVRLTAANAMKRNGWKNMAKNRVLAILFSLACLTGITVCMICDMAVCGRLTWSPVATGSVVFAWGIVFPSIVWGKRGVMGSLLSVSIFTVPYLFLLSCFIEVEEVFSIGAVMAVMAIIFLWIIAAVFIRVGRKGKPAALGIVFLAAVPFLLLINGVLSNMIAEPVFDLWDALSVFVLLVSAFVSFFAAALKKKDG